MLRYLRETLAGGELPLWNPFHFSGHPAVADPHDHLGLVLGTAFVPATAAGARGGEDGAPGW